MSYEERKEQRRSNVRNSMDIGMGLFYAIIGSIVISAKAFGKMALPAYIAYILGGMMVIGGVFRFYRGVKAVLPQKNSDDDTTVD